jgi:hypothetical protein
MQGIWFWCIIGVGIGASLVYAMGDRAWPTFKISSGGQGI